MTAPTTEAAAAAGSGAEASSVQLAASARTVQVAIRTRVLRDVTRLWPLLDRHRLDETFPGWLRAMMLLLRNYHGQSSAAAGAFYRQARAEALQAPTPRSLIRLSPPPAEDWMARALGFAGPGMLEQDTARPNTALATTLGTSSRIALDGGRRTVIDTAAADPVAVGYYRVTDGDPCAFCALLASRGVVYTKESVDFKAHNGCGCTTAPAFSRNQELPAQAREWQALYNEVTGPYSGQAKLVAFRQAFEGREVTGRDATATKQAAARAAEPKVGKTGRTRHEIESELAALEANLPKLTSPGPIAFHEKRIAELKKLLGR